ncbi:transcription termination/antitermination NusG family protein, partial [Mycolicibacterium sp.]
MTTFDGDETLADETVDVDAAPSETAEAEATDETTAADETPVADGAEEAPVAEEAPSAEEAPAEDEDPAVALKKELRLKPGDWYVIHSYAGYENKVKANLETRVQNLDVGDYIFQVEVPTEEVTEIKN